MLSFAPFLFTGILKIVLNRNNLVSSNRKVAKIEHWIITLCLGQLLVVCKSCMRVCTRTIGVSCIDFRRYVKSQLVS